MADKAKTFKLTAPDGTKVEVVGESRRDTLVKRGYTEGSGTRSSSSTTSSKS